MDSDKLKEGYKLAKKLHSKNLYNYEVRAELKKIGLSTTESSEVLIKLGREEKLYFKSKYARFEGYVLVLVGVIVATAGIWWSFNIYSSNNSIFQSIFGFHSLVTILGIILVLGGVVNLLIFKK